jgi:predicted TIM-barrel fold metal-dependent hydrolase
MDHRIDVFCHILPPRFEKAKWERAEKSHFVQHSPVQMKYIQGGKDPRSAYACLTDLDARFRVMDEFENYRQVISVGTPAVETVAPDDSEYVAKILNDELAELVQKYPQRFVGAVASLPMDKPDAAARELERSIRDLKLIGVQIFSNVNGKPLDLPEFRPIFEIMSRYNLPILLHPARSKSRPDYLSETHSKYFIWQVLGWPVETSVASVRLVFSGILDDYPNLKIILHHTGAMLPFFAGRIKMLYNNFQPLMESEGVARLKKPVMDYFRSFYADTSTFTSASIDCAVDFFGPDHVLFGTDAPYDAEGGTLSIRASTAAVESGSLSGPEKAKIFWRNFEAVFRQSIVADARTHR